MRTSSAIYNKRHFTNKDYWDFYRDYTEYLWDRRTSYCGEPLELPKTLREIIREGLLNDKGDINDY